VHKFTILASLVLALAISSAVSAQCVVSKGSAGKYEAREPSHLLEWRDTLKKNGQLTAHSEGYIESCLVAFRTNKDRIVAIDAELAKPSVCYVTHPYRLRPWKKVYVMRGMPQNVRAAKEAEKRMLARANTLIQLNGMIVTMPIMPTGGGYGSVSFF